MLSLSRRPGESVFIGDDVSVSVHSVKGNRVRLAIDAPRDVSIRRSELLHEGLLDLSPTDQPVLSNGCFAEVLTASS